MVELVVVAALAFCAFVVIGTLVAAGSIVVWLLWLPFQLLGWLFRGLGFLIVLPFVLIGGVIAAVALGVGALFLFVPLVPLLALALVVAWLVRRSVQRPIAS